jgi:hypothetical protein
MTREAVRINNFFFSVFKDAALFNQISFIAFLVIEKNKGHFGKTWRKTLKLIMAYSYQSLVKKKKV